MKNNAINFKKKGYVKVNNIFSKSEINNYLNSIKINLINIGYGGKKNYRKKNLDWLINDLYINKKDKFSKFYTSLQSNSFTCRLSLNTRLINIVTSLLKIEKESIVLGDLTVRLDNPGISTAAIGWHQESSYYSEIKNFDKSILIWFPLREITENGGGLSFIPGSHLKGQRKYKFDNKIDDYVYPEIKKIIKKTRSEKFIGKAGSVLACNFNLFHASTPNLTSEFRLSAAFRYFSTETKNINPFKRVRINKNFIKYRLEYIS
jgi:ectoine hydroxylase-related dioxygenase (phytanoyl-CoA dioxygenase family)